MNNFNKKQKILIGILSSLIIVVICYYVYAREDEEFITTNSLEVQEVKEEEQTIESDFILVHVSGAVNKEGVVELKANSRISEAIDKSEGLKEEADISKINLAFKLEDGMKIYIPLKEEQKNIIEENNNQKILEVENQNNSKNNEEVKENYITTSSGIEEYTKTESVEIKNIKININTATQTELETLPGIGPSTALKIMDYRKENGKFNNTEDIKNVSGIGEVKYNKIKDLIICK